MTGRWTIAMGDHFYFDVVEVVDLKYGEFGSDADLNGRFPTKLAAVEYQIACQDEIRESLMMQIARAKRMRNRLLRSLSNPSNEGGDRG